MHDHDHLCHSRGQSAVRMDMAEMALIASSQESMSPIRSEGYMISWSPCPSRYHDVVEGMTDGDFRFHLWSPRQCAVLSNRNE